MNSKLEQFGQKFIYFLLIIWLSTEVLFSSNIEYFFYWTKKDANDYMAIIVFALLMFQIILLQKYKFEEIMTIALITIPISLATINSDHKTMMSTWIFIVASKYLDLDKTIKISYIVQLIMVLFVIYMFYVGMIDEVTVYRGNVLRHSLGFTHPNHLGIRIFQMVLCHCFLRRNHIIILDYGLIAAAAWFIKTVADSKTSYYAMIILVIFMIMHNVFKKVHDGLEFLANIMVGIFVSSGILSVLLSIINVRHFHLLNLFDKFMSRRFWNCYRLYRFYGISLFGKDIKLLVWRHGVGQYYRFWLDNAYMTILERYGITVFFVFMGIYLVTMIYLKRTKQYMLLEILALYAIYGIMESNFFSMSQNVFLITLSYPIYFRNKEIENVTRKRVRFSLC